jgi:alkanesulfonate monooxygenase SsuD/methylene tetrahydromethanopterin reductase-like flavin-dependent oxidoreductase (luciferase family)
VFDRAVEEIALGEPLGFESAWLAESVFYPPLLLAANSNDTFPYAARLGVGVIGTTLTQPMPRLGQRLAEYAAAKPPMR